MKTCKNCGQLFEGNFCPNCGQRWIEQRISLRSSVNYTIAKIFNLDRGIWRTLLELIRKPQKVVSGYLNGVTVPYMNPFRMLFVLVTIQTILFVSTGRFDKSQSYFTELFGTSESSQRQQEFQLQYLSMVTNYLNILLMLAVPGLAFGTKLLFRKARLNYAEHLVINSYAFAIITAFGFLLFPLYLININYSIPTTLSLILSVGFLFYYFHRVFSQSWWKSFIKGILALLAWYISLIFIMIVLAVIMVTRQVMIT